jgi:chromosome segregation ATPase
MMGRNNSPREYHIYFHNGDTDRLAELSQGLKQLGLKIDQLIKKEEIMSQELDDLTQKVSDSTTVQESAITLLNDLGQRIRDLADDPAAIRALADQLDSEKNKLADAITANTPQG